MEWKNNLSFTKEERSEMRQLSKRAFEFSEKFSVNLNFEGYSKDSIAVDEVLSATMRLAAIALRKVATSAYHQGVDGAYSSYERVPRSRNRAIIQEADEQIQLNELRKSDWIAIDLLKRLLELPSPPKEVAIRSEWNPASFVECSAERVAQIDDFAALAAAMRDSKPLNDLFSEAQRHSTKPSARIR